VQRSVYAVVLASACYAVGVQLDKAIAFRERDPDTADQAIRDARASGASALQDVRTAVKALREPSLQELGRRLEGDDLRITVETAQVPQEHGEVLYRAAQEALTNVRRHARASQAVVQLSKSGGSWRLVVRDDGVGFEDAAVESGWGLIGLRERVLQLGGTVDVASEPGAGTCLTVSLPAS
jgi:signal transduction histidine kinase